MNPVRASLRYPQVTIALTIMLVASGAYALMRMPRREDPKIHVREGIVAAMYPGASAGEVENQVTQKIEQRLFKLEGVRREKTYSTSMNGAMFINLNLEDNLQDTEKFWSKLRLEMAELKQTDLPQGVLGPVVDYDFGDTVAVLLAIHSDHYDYRELKDYAERIESAIRRIRAVSKVKRIGEQKEEIDVSSTLSRLSQYAVSADQVKKALEGRTAAGPQRDAEHALGLGDDPQAAGLPDDDELAADAALDLVPGPVPPAHLLVGDELQRERVSHRAGQLAEGQRLRQRRYLHVLRAARVQPHPVAARPELLRRSRHDVQVRVEDDPEAGRSESSSCPPRYTSALGLPSEANRSTVNPGPTKSST